MHSSANGLIACRNLSGAAIFSVYLSYHIISLELSPPSRDEHGMIGNLQGDTLCLFIGLG